MGIILTCDIDTTACAAFNVDGTKISDVRIEYTTEYPCPGWGEAYAHVYDVFRQGTATSARYTSRSGSVNAQENCD